MSIQQFRAALAGRSEHGTLVRAYRELARRPAVASATRLAGWVAWPDPGAPTASV